MFNSLCEPRRSSEPIYIHELEFLVKILNTCGISLLAFFEIKTYIYHILISTQKSTKLSIIWLILSQSKKLNTVIIIEIRFMIFSTSTSDAKYKTNISHDSKRIHWSDWELCLIRFIKQIVTGVGYEIWSLTRSFYLTEF